MALSLPSDAKQCLSVINSCILDHLAHGPKIMRHNFLAVSLGPMHWNLWTHCICSQLS